MLVRHRPGTVPTREPDGAKTTGAAAPWIDLLVLGLVLAALGAALAVGREWVRPRQGTPPIDLSLTALPGYAGLSLARGILAYLLSLVFTVGYGTAAARDPRAERLMMPALDVLQSIPVLSFMPGFVLGLVALFPGSRLGLELACVLAIFTGQVWNMTFSYHASLRAIPADLEEVASLYSFGPLERVYALELPCAAIALLWNSMMSMAGGWFFLTVVESFTLGGTDYRLPGLGSYMAAASLAGDLRAQAAGAVTMAAMILLVDQLVWRPALVWAERFRLGEASAASPPRSFVHGLLSRSRLAARLGALLAPNPSRSRPKGPPPRWPMALVRGVAAGGALALTLGGGVSLLRLLGTLAGADWLAIVVAFAATATRVFAAVLLGAAWTVPVGIAIGRRPRLAQALQPLIQVAASFPAPMLYPLAALTLVRMGAGGNTIAILLTLLATHWYILFNVVAGAAALPQDLREVADVFRLQGLRRFVLLDLAGVFPALVTGLVTAAGGAWNASIVSESVLTPTGRFEVPGIGSLIARAFESNDHARLAGATVVLAAALVLIHRILWDPLYRLSDRRFALNR